MAAWRRLLLIDVVKELDYCKGWQSKAAERLGVNRSTVCRDLKILRKYYFYVKAATESGHLKTVKTSKKEDKFLDWSIEDCKKTAWEQIEERKHDFKEKNL